MLGGPRSCAARDYDRSSNCVPETDPPFDNLARFIARLPRVSPHDRFSGAALGRAPADNAGGLYWQLDTR